MPRLIRGDESPEEGADEEVLLVDVRKYYNVERLRPKYETLIRQPLFIMTSDV